MPDRTPDLATIRDAYAYHTVDEDVYHHRDYLTDLDDQKKKFDSWLAEHDRQTAEVAWNEGQQAGLRRADFEYGHATIQAVKTNPYRQEQTDE